MTFEARIAVIGLAAFASTGLLAVCLVPFATRHIVTGAAVTRARRLAALRLLPSVAALAAGTLVTLSFVFFEPRQNGEEIGTGRDQRCDKRPAPATPDVRTHSTTDHESLPSGGACRWVHP